MKLKGRTIIINLVFLEIIFNEVDGDLKITSFYNDGDDINEKDVILKVSSTRIKHCIYTTFRMVSHY